MFLMDLPPSLTSPADDSLISWCLVNALASSISQSGGPRGSLPAFPLFTISSSANCRLVKMSLHREIISTGKVMVLVMMAVVLMPTEEVGADDFLYLLMGAKLLEQIA